MKCPICGDDSAFLWDEDGTPDPGKNIPITIRCGGKCKGEDPINDPVHVASLEIDIVVKRGSLIIEEPIIYRR